MTPEQIKTIQQAARKITNDELVERIQFLKKSIAEKHPLTTEENDSINEAMLKARFIAPVALHDVDSANPNAARVQFSHVGTKDGKKYIIVFTDMKTLLKNAKDDEKLLVIGFTFGDLVKAMGDPSMKMNGFVINPFTENIVCGEAQIKGVMMYLQKKKYDKGELSVINEVTGIPDEVTSPMTNYFDKRGDVKKAYIMNMRKVDAFNRLVIVDFEGDEDKFKEFAQDFSEQVLKPINDEKAPYVVMSFDQPAAKQATREQVPFYVKI